MSGSTPVIIEVPAALGLLANGVQDAPDALRAAGLHTLLNANEVRRVTVPRHNPVRDPRTQILNPNEIALLARRLARHVDDTLAPARFPVVLGGDCSLLLGPLLALRRRGRYGLAFIDCHADFLHPSDEPTGEAASLELALATGRGPSILADLDGHGPLVLDQDVVLIGYRAFDDNDHYLNEHVRDTAMTIIDLPRIREVGPHEALEPARAHLTKAALDGFWVHFDVDVIDDSLMTAVDHHYPGGLSWRELDEILQALLATRGTAGIDMTIFNPRLDVEGTLASRLVELLSAAVNVRPPPSSRPLTQ